MSLPLAIAQIESEITALGQGTPAQPTEGSTEWFRLRALGIGLTFLRDVQKRELDSGAAERHRRLWAKEAKREAVV